MKRMCTLLVMTILIAAMLFNSIVSAYAYALYYDVFDDYWAYESIQYVKNANLFNGYEDGNFLPDNTMTRAEAIKVIVVFLDRDKAPSCTSFTDVDNAEWYAPYVEAGKDLLPSTPVGGKFRPDEAITREDTIYAIVRTMKLNLEVQYVDTSILKKFKDYEKISPETAPYLAVAIQKGLISGYSDGTVRPKDSLTRAEFATLLHRAVKTKNGESKYTSPLEPDAEKAELMKEKQEVKYDEASFQNEVMNLVNTIRRENGLKELTVNTKLSQVAQLKADDMHDNNYFDQVSPKYGTTFDMIDDMGVNYAREAGANLAKGSATPEDVVNSWMNSKNHKANILNATYTQSGVGYVSEGNIWVQTFIG